MLGRTLAAFRAGQIRISRVYAWILRTALCVLGMSFRHPVDAMALIVWAFAALALAGGYWQAAHPKPPEDLTHEIFPPE